MRLRALLTAFLILALSSTAWTEPPSRRFVFANGTVSLELPENWFIIPPEREDLSFPRDYKGKGKKLFSAACCKEGPELSLRLGVLLFDNPAQCTSQTMLEECIPVLEGQGWDKVVERARAHGVHLDEFEMFKETVGDNHFVVARGVQKEKRGIFILDTNVLSNEDRQVQLLFVYPQKYQSVDAPIMMRIKRSLELR